LRNKISFFDEAWIKLKVIVKYYKEKEGINVSSGQIASAIVHTDISKMDTSKIASALSDKFPAINFLSPWGRGLR